MMDKSLGRIDIDIIATGQPKSRVDKLKTVLEIVKELEEKYDMVSINQVVDEARNYDIDESLCRKLVDELLRKTSDLYEPRHGFVKVVKPKVD
jgi:DNA replicative helicase MCM subunit Mcm2 (Cdc46/Mcm family)